MLHLWALFNLAVTQSAYSRLVGQPEYLIHPEVTPDAIVGLGLTLSVILPGVILGSYFIFVKSLPRTRDAVRLAVVFLMALLIFLQAARSWEVSGLFNFLMAACGAVVASWLYQRYEGVRQVIGLCAISILLTPWNLYREFWGADVTAVFRLDRDETKPRVPVVLIVFDEFPGTAIMNPEKSIDANRFPNLAQLANQSHWYRNACGASTLTARALPAILTGAFPEVREFATVDKYPQNLFQAMISGAGYQHAAFEPVSILAPQTPKVASISLRQQIQRTWDVLHVLSTVYLFDVLPAQLHPSLPEIPKVWFGLSPNQQIDRSAQRGGFRYGWTISRDEQFKHLIDCITDDPEGVLYFGHFLMPHAPYCFFPSGNRYYPDSEDMNVGCLAEGSAETDELGLIQSQQRFLMQLMMLDQFIGRLVDRLKAQGIYDESLLIITADHGVSFRLNSARREFSPGNYADIARIPLFVKLPHLQEGQIHEEYAQSVDIVPTIFDVVGIRPSLPMDGRKLDDPKIMDRNEITVIDNHVRRRIPVAELSVANMPEQIRARFGTGVDRWDLYRIGPHADWLGTSIDQYTITPRAAHQLVCLAPQEHLTDQSHQEFFVEGTLVGVPPDRPVEIVVAVDGVICATTRTYSQFGYRERWSAMLPEWSYTTPASTPQFFTVTGERELTPCQVSWKKKIRFGEFEESPLP